MQFEHYFPPPPIDGRRLCTPITCSSDLRAALKELQASQADHMGGMHLSTSTQMENSFLEDLICDRQCYFYRTHLDGRPGLISLQRNAHLGWWPKYFSDFPDTPPSAVARLGTLMVWHCLEAWNQGWSAPELPLEGYSPVTTPEQLFHFHWLTALPIFETSFEADFYKPSDRIAFRFTAEGIPLLAQLIKDENKWTLRRLFFSHKYAETLSLRQTEGLLHSIQRVLPGIPPPDQWTSSWSSHSIAPPPWEPAESTLALDAFCEINPNGPSIIDNSSFF